MPQTLSDAKLNIKSVKSNLSKFIPFVFKKPWAKDDSLAFYDYIVCSTVRVTSGKRGHAGVSVIIKKQLSDLVVRVER